MGQDHCGPTQCEHAERAWFGGVSNDYVIHRVEVEVGTGRAAALEHCYRCDGGAGNPSEKVRG